MAMTDETHQQGKDEFAEFKQLQESAVGLRAERQRRAEHLARGGERRGEVEDHADWMHVNGAGLRRRTRKS
jgi:hypothetical protein